MEKEQKSRKIVFYTFLEVLATLVLTAMWGMWDWVNMSFDFTRVLSASYWENTVFETGMYSLAMIIAILYVLGYLETKSKEYADILTDYRNKLENEGMRQSVTSRFVMYINDVLNPIIKIEYIKKKVDLKLWALDRVTKSKIKFELTLYNKGKIDNLSRKAKRYKAKLEMLTSMKDDEYLKENYMNINCKYPRVNAYAFTWYVSVKATDYNRYKVENRAFADVFLVIVRKIFFSFAGAAIMVMFVVTPNGNQLLEQANGWIALLMNYIFRFIMICVNFVMGVFTARRLFYANNMLPISNRISILDKFHEYVLANPEECKNELQNYKDSIKAEMKEEMESRIEAYKEEVKNKIRVN